MNFTVDGIIYCSTHCKLLTRGFKDIALKKRARISIILYLFCTVTVHAWEYLWYWLSKHNDLNLEKLPWGSEENCFDADFRGKENSFADAWVILIKSLFYNLLLLVQPSRPQRSSIDLVESRNAFLIASCECQSRWFPRKVSRARVQVRRVAF